MKWWQKILLRLLEVQAPRLIAWLLDLLDVDDCVELVKPHIEKVRDKLPEKYASPFDAFLRKIGEFFLGLADK